MKVLLKKLIVALGMASFTPAGGFLRAAILWICVGGMIAAPYAQAQIRAQVPSDKELFEEDLKGAQTAREAAVSQAIQADKPLEDDLEVKAPQMQYDQESKNLVGSGGVLVSKQGATFQADQATVNLDSKRAVFEDNIVFYYPGGSITADRADVNVETETGEFEKANATLEQGFYHIEAERLNKISEFDYTLEDAEFTTCHCADGSRPWVIGCSSADAEQEGYAFTRGTYLRMFGVPLLYTPYFLFPLKVERQSGLLAPSFGQSDKNGFAFSIPLFVVLDGSSDFTLKPFIQTKTRIGSSLEYRRVFSEKSEMKGRVVYSNESARGDSLRGTDTDGLYDPTFEKNRIGGFYSQIWRSAPESSVPLGFVVDGHYVPDSLFLREIPDEDIGLADARYTSSRAVAQASPTQDIYGELSAEYNQSLVENQDLIFQRVPELYLSAQRSVRPFGFNPYGLKVVPALNITATDFTRKTGFEGSRADFAPSLRVPFHYQNYFKAQTTATLHETVYDNRDETWPNDPDRLVTKNQRSVFRVDQSLSSGVERVYQLKEDSWLTQMAALGYADQGRRLRRIKHTIEPFGTYSYVPDRNQEGLPLYDPLDRIRQRSLFTYGVRTNLLGRFVPINTGGEDISELTPDVEDLPVLDTETPLADYGVPGGFGMGAQKFGMRQGEIRDLVTLRVWQSYDALEPTEQEKVDNPKYNQLSDIGFGLGVAPTRSFTFTFDGNYGLEEADLSSWGVGGNLRDDRGDVLKTRYSFIDGSISQLELGAEVVLSERLSVGYYGRYDVREREFFRNTGALRIYSACKCWHLDLGFSETLNPDNQEATLRFTFKGLGDVSQNLAYGSSNSSGM
ncbi:MAG: LPS-assembly protein LptD [Deltaproteobacteria bacterium]|nr:LPS-assembly protein LptD [Deltaproteobacteria bacterium]